MDGMWGKRGDSISVFPVFFFLKPNWRRKKNWERIFGKILSLQSYFDRISSYFGSFLHKI